MNYKIDAKSRPLGRVASEIAVILQGKRSARYSPNKTGDDNVVVNNVSKLSMTGDRKKKIYYRHTGYMGHLKSKTFEEAFKKNPELVLREAVRRMLPKNKLAKERLKKT